MFWPFIFSIFILRLSFSFFFFLPILYPPLLSPGWQLSGLEFKTVGQSSLPSPSLQQRAHTNIFFFLQVLSENRREERTICAPKWLNSPLLHQSVQYCPLLFLCQDHALKSQFSVGNVCIVHRHPLLLHSMGHQTCPEWWSTHCIDLDMHWRRKLLIYHTSLFHSHPGFLRTSLSLLAYISRLHCLLLLCLISFTDVFFPVSLPLLHHFPTRTMM